MKKFILGCLCDIASAFAMVLCGKEALETTNFWLCILYWFGVYFTLDLHVYLTNYIKKL
jgi:hypothetical protein